MTTLSCGDPHFSLRVVFAEAIVGLLSPTTLTGISYALIWASVFSRASSLALGKRFATCTSNLTVVSFCYTSALFTYVNPHSTHGPDKDTPFSLLYTITAAMCKPIIYSFQNKERKGAMVRALDRPAWRRRSLSS